MKKTPSTVFGYAVGNDLQKTPGTANDKAGEPSRLISRIDTWACLGQEIVTGLDYNNRRLTTRLNGDIVQDGNTNELIQDVPELIAYVSRFITLEPGDLIYTGTVLFKEGARRKMQVGDVGSYYRGNRQRSEHLVPIDCSLLIRLEPM